MFVGPERVKFIVHRDRLCNCSSFFKAALDARWQQSGIDQIIELPEDNLKAVQTFVEWLYSASSVRLDYDPYEEDLEDDLYSQWREHHLEPIKALIFADKYDIPRFKLKLIKKLRSYWRNYDGTPPSHDAISYAYLNTCRGSSIRRFLADWLCSSFRSSWYQDDWVQEWLLSMPEFAVDMVVAQSSVERKGEKGEKIATCPWFEKDAHDYMDNTNIPTLPVPEIVLQRFRVLTRALLARAAGSDAGSL